MPNGTTPRPTGRTATPPPAPVDRQQADSLPESVERLYCCPECDEFIPEDAFEDHQAQCAAEPRRLIDMNQRQVMDEVTRRMNANPDWARGVKDLEKQVDSIVGRAKDAWLPRLNSNFGYSSSASFVGQSNVHPSLLTSTYTVNEVRVQVPQGLDQDTLRAIVREQLLEIHKETYA